MKRIIYDDGTGRVVHVIPCRMVEDPPDFTDNDALKRALAKDVPPGVQAHVIDEADLPAREDRDGWELRNGRARVKAGWVRPITMQSQ